MTKADAAFRRQLDGYALATAQIFYRMPDARNVLQTYVWQDYDMAPTFPTLRKFLDFWMRELDGPIHSVELTHAHLIGPREFRYCDRAFVVH